MRLIDAEELLEHLEACLHNGRPLSNLYDLSEIVRYVKSMPTIADSPWHRVEEEPKDGQECIVAYLGPTDWIYEHATYHRDLNKALEEDIFIEGTDGFIVDGGVGYARHGLFKYWMPIDPPKEENDA